MFPQKIIALIKKNKIEKSLQTNILFKKQLSILNFFATDS